MQLEIFCISELHTKDRQNVIITDSLEQALQVVKQHELEHTVRFSTRAATKDFGAIGMLAYLIFLLLIWLIYITQYMSLQPKILKCLVIVCRNVYDLYHCLSCLSRVFIQKVERECGAEGHITCLTIFDVCFKK